MSSGVNRRTFIRHSIVGAAAALATSQVVSAAEPPAQEREARFRISLAAYSYRDLLQGKQAQLTLSDFITDCAAMRLDGVELTSYYFPNPVTPEYLRQLKGECFRQGLDVSGTAVGNDFGLPAGLERQQSIDQVKKWSEYAEILGAPVIRIFAGHVPKGESPEAVHPRIVEAIEECSEHAGRFGVHLALENHGGPTATADGLLALVKDVRSPWFGVNVDTGNFRSNDIYGDLAKIAPYALNVQVKVVMTNAEGKSEPADFARLAEIFRESRYRGYIVLEYEEKGDPRVECPKYMDQLRAAFALPH